MNMNYIEVKIIDQCNYQCKACIPFSNISENRSYPIDQFQYDIKRLSQLIDYIQEFRILGGEPLLSENLMEYIRIVVRYFNKSNITLVTNGLLFQRLTKADLDYFLEKGIKIFVSVYPDEKKSVFVYQQIEKMKSFGLSVSSYNVIHFGVNHDFDSSGKNEFQISEIYQRCRRVVDCTNLYNGKIYACPKPFSLCQLNSYFGTQFTNDHDGIDIYDSELNGQQIMERLNHPMDTCKYCTARRGFIKWETPKQHHISDWLNTPANEALITAMSTREEIDEILNITAVHIYRHNGRYQQQGVKIDLGFLSKCQQAILVFGEKYSLINAELMEIAFRKINFDIAGIINADSFLLDIFSAPKIDPVYICKHPRDHYLVLDNKELNAFRVAAKMVKTLNIGDVYEI